MTDTTAAPAADPNPESGHDPQRAETATPEEHIAANVQTAADVYNNHLRVNPNRTDAEKESILRECGDWLHRQLGGLIADVDTAVARIKAIL